MKIKLNLPTVAGFCLILPGFALALMNWFYLMGLMVKPPDDLIEARWWFVIFSSIVGGFLVLLGYEHE